MYAFQKHFQCGNRPQNISYIWVFCLQNENILKLKKQFEQVGTFFDQDGRLFGYERFTKHFNLNLSFVDFYSLTHSIPRDWKFGFTFAVEMPECFMQKPLKDLFGMKKVYKRSYDLMLTKVDYKRGHTIKWNLIFDKTILDSDWNIYFSNIFRCTIESKMRSFQYKILLRVIPTNKYLHICQISNTDKCCFCYVNVNGGPILNIEHLFWYCSVIKTFWFDVFVMFDGILNIDKILTAENILLGYKRSEHSRLINHLLILIKHYIYKKKSLEQN